MAISIHSTGILLPNITSWWCTMSEFYFSYFLPRLRQIQLSTFGDKNFVGWNWLNDIIDSFSCLATTAAALGWVQSQICACIVLDYHTPQWSQTTPILWQHRALLENYLLVHQGTDDSPAELLCCRVELHHIFFDFNWQPHIQIHNRWPWKVYIWKAGTEIIKSMFWYTLQYM